MTTIGKLPFTPSATPVPQPEPLTFERFWPGQVRQITGRGGEQLLELSGNFNKEHEADITLSLDSDGVPTLHESFLLEDRGTRPLGFREMLNLEESLREYMTLRIATSIDRPLLEKFIDRLDQIIGLHLP